MCRLYRWHWRPAYLPCFVAPASVPAGGRGSVLSVCRAPLSALPLVCRDRCGESLRKVSAMSDDVKRRKAEHVNMALQHDLTAQQAACWADVRLVHQALPEVD